MKLNFSAGSIATMAPKSSRHGRSGARARGPVIDVDDGDGELPDVRGLQLILYQSWTLVLKLLCHCLCHCLLL